MIKKDKLYCINIKGGKRSVECDIIEGSVREPHLGCTSRFQSGPLFKETKSATMNIFFLFSF